MTKNPSIPPAPTPIEQILDLARWAPSGDNTQPWRFEIKSENHFVVHGNDTRSHCVYDLKGHASQIALGTLLETITIAASDHRLRCDFRRRADAPETQPTFDVHLENDSAIEPDPLLPNITTRCTQRRPMRSRRLTDQERQALEAAVGPDYRVVWVQGTGPKFSVARLLFKNAHIRLTTHEAYLVHKEIIEWHARYSDDRIPDQAVGLDPVAIRMMQWAMGSWGRVQFMNRFLAGTWLPRLQMDVLTAIRCGAHFMIVGPQAPTTIDDFIAGGRATQRFWLTADRLGLQFQPEMTPLIFASYVRDHLRFTTCDSAWRRAHTLADQLNHLFGQETCEQAVFMGRVGAGKTPKSRSFRLSLKQLIQTPN